MITPISQSQHGVLIWEHSVPTLTPLQVKLARTAVGLGVRELARMSGVAPSTIQRFESGRGDMQSRTLNKVQQFLESAGVIFIPADLNGGPGLRMRQGAIY